MSNYDDIINIQRPLSKRAKMSLHDRAAQFAPFAALGGYDDAVKETARIVDERIELDEESLMLLDQKFLEIRNKIKEKPLVSITYFVKDLKKAGGQYITKEVNIKKIDDDNHSIVTTDNQFIDIDDVYYIDLK